jgi:CO/xanthine dehydrogenase Mo-binding subunit
VFKHIHIEKGDASTAMATADIVIEGVYRTGAQEHVYIEPNGVIAVPEDGGIAVHGSIQCPYYVHKALVALLGTAVSHVRVVQTETGGGFGGKEEFPSVIAGHAALLALKARRPVKIIYDRTEDMIATTKRHPSVVRHRTGVARDGRIVAMDIDVMLDGGAYVTLSPVVLSRGTIHASGPYRCHHTRIVGRAVMTNTPPNGAFRGFGAPQTQFAMEVHMDRIAETLGMDPVRLREVNALRAGDTTATGQTLGADCSALETLSRAVRKSRYHEKRAVARAQGRGIGVSLFYHGSGFTGSGELRLASRGAGVDRARRACADVEHRDRAGHADDARADRRRCVRRAVRVRRGGAAGHVQGPGQRADGGVAHVHGGRRDPAACGGRAPASDW